jgi:nicotinamide-nucleotide amidase
MKLPNKIRIAILAAIALFTYLQQCSVRAADSQPSNNKVSTSKTTKYMIVVTGSELLSGAYPDGHTCFITRILRPLGLECIGSMIVDDKQADIEETLHYATDKAELVIVTGGLGPTDNDITRQTLSDFTGIALKEQPDVLRQMAQKFHVPPDQLRANLRRQTQVPANGTYFRNTEGTAVGLVFNTAGSVIVALPGPPRELQTMVRNELVPYLSKRFGTRLPGCSLTLRFVGLGQSQIDQSLKDNVPLAPDIAVSSQFEGGRVDFTFSLPEDTPQYKARLKELEQKIMKHLGEYIYADDETSLEQRVLGLLKAHGQKLALAEVGSGGSLTAALSSADADGQILAGAFVAPTLEKLYSLLKIDYENPAGRESSDQRIKRLALAVANATESQWAVAVGDARQDQNGSGYVEVAFKPPDGRLESRQVQLSGSGELARTRLSTQLLDELRRRLK